MLGVDPGTAVCGYGVVAAGAGRSGTLVECGVIRTSRTDPLARRLRTVADDLAAVIERLRPDVIAVEGLFHGRNARSALVLGHARGVVLLTAARAGVEVTEISPAEVKRAVTGTGAASKDQVAAMLTRHLKLAAPPRPADAADGVAIAFTQLMRIGIGVPRP